MDELTTPAWLVEAALGRLNDFATQLRQVGDGATAVPNMDWSVADLAQHVACLPQLWNGQNEARDHFERPDSFADFSDQARAHITEADPVLLADLIEEEFKAFLSQLQQDGQNRWLYGLQTTPTNLCGLAVNELVLHGRDLASVTGVGLPTFTRPEANAAVDAVMVTTPAFIDADKASAQPDGIYSVRFRGGNDYTWTKRGPDLVIAMGKPNRYDARLVADPAVFLLASLGRISQTRAALSGGMISYGRRPWRFLGLGTMAAEGI